MSQAIHTQESAQTTLRPLCVDLDGTLVKSDTLVIVCWFWLAGVHPLLLALPGKLMRGKAVFLKAFVTESISLNVLHLPYNRKLLTFLEDQHRLGREIYLATGANIELARRVAKHLGIFKGVLGSEETGDLNLSGSNKLDRLRSSLGPREFDYIGNASVDLPLLSHSTQPMVANSSIVLRVRMRSRKIRPAMEFEERNHPARLRSSAPCGRTSGSRICWSWRRFCLLTSFPAAIS